jgi:hypothetical protein
MGNFVFSSTIPAFRQFLQSRCLAMDVCSGSTIPTFNRHVVVYSSVASEEILIRSSLIRSYICANIWSHYKRETCRHSRLRSSTVHALSVSLLVLAKYIVRFLFLLFSQIRMHVGGYSLPICLIFLWAYFSSES